MSERATVPALLQGWATAQADKPFMITEQGVLTYGELERSSRQFAASLIDNGVGKGSRIGLLMPNGLDWAVIAMGVLRLGAVLVPLSTLLRPPELEVQLRVAGVDRLVAVAGFRNRDYLTDLASIDQRLVGDGPVYVAALPRLRSVTFWRDGGARAAERPDAEQLVGALGDAVKAADDMAIMFTSGSRGSPKGIIHTHGGAIGATAAGLEARCLGPDDRLYIPMPFFWVGGFGAGLLSVLVAGATLLSEAEPEPGRTLRFLERERVTLFRGWPDQAAALSAHPGFSDVDLTSLKAGSLDAVLPARLRGSPGRRPSLLGMTESFGPYCGDRLDLDLPERKDGSCGRPFAGVDVRIVDVTTGRELPPGETGEIQIRGANVMRGICRRRWAETFTPDGYYATGDLGRIDGDGYLFFTGRRDDMFKVKGATVYPSEVEAALLTLPMVRRAFVVDVRQGGPVEVAAAVVTADSDCTIDDIDQLLRARLSAFKVPTRWAIIEADAVPMLATGKLDKSALQALFSMTDGAS